LIYVVDPGRAPYAGTKPIAKFLGASTYRIQAGYKGIHPETAQARACLAGI